MRHGLATVSTKGDFDSLAPSGRFPLRGFADLIQSYLYFVVVALVIAGTDFDSPNTTGKTLLMDFNGLKLPNFGPASPNSTGPKLLMSVIGLIQSISDYTDAVEGSSRGRNGIFKFHGPTGPKRDKQTSRNYHKSHHTSQRTQVDSSTSTSYLVTTKLIFRSTYQRSSRIPQKHTAHLNYRTRPCEMTKTGGKVVIHQLSRNCTMQGRNR